jgi:hypothetical protein
MAAAEVVRRSPGDCDAAHCATPWRASSIVLERFMYEGPVMSMAHATEKSPRVGDHVILRGTRIVGDVAHVEGKARISVKVTEVLGTSSTSKAARAWRGAWVTCTPTMVSAVSPSSI